MVAFIDDHRQTYGVEPICRVLPIAPSTYFRRKAEQPDPTRRSARAQRDEVLRAIIQRIWHEHHQVYGPRKVWRQMGRENLRAASRQQKQGRLARLSASGRWSTQQTDAQDDDTGGEHRCADIRQRNQLVGLGRIRPED
jgi:transposase InsO family protein